MHPAARELCHAIVSDPTFAPSPVPRPWSCMSYTTTLPSNCCIIVATAVHEISVWVSYAASVSYLSYATSHPTAAPVSKQDTIRLIGGRAHGVTSLLEPNLCVNGAWRLCASGYSRVEVLVADASGSGQEVWSPVCYPEDAALRQQLAKLVCEQYYYYPWAEPVFWYISSVAGDSAFPIPRGECRLAFVGDGSGDLAALRGFTDCNNFKRRPQISVWRNVQLHCGVAMAALGGGPAKADSCACGAVMCLVSCHAHCCTAHQANSTTLPCACYRRVLLGRTPCLASVPRCVLCALPCWLQAVPAPACRPRRCMARQPRCTAARQPRRTAHRPSRGAPARAAPPSSKTPCRVPFILVPAATPRGAAPGGSALVPTPPTRLSREALRRAPTTCSRRASR